MKKAMRRRTLVLFLSGVLALGLSGCGGSATVSHEEASGAPGPASTVPSDSAKDPGKKGKEEDAKNAREKNGDSARAGAGPAAADGRDSGAREVEEAPQAGQPSPQERGFLEALQDGGVDTGSNQDDLVGVARLVCGTDSGRGASEAKAPADQGAQQDPAQPGAAGTQVTLDAVAGQLVEQKKTKLSQRDTARLLEDSARAQYC